MADVKRKVLVADVVFNDECSKDFRDFGLSQIIPEQNVNPWYTIEST